MKRCIHLRAVTHRSDGLHTSARTHIPAWKMHTLTQLMGKADQAINKSESSNKSCKTRLHPHELLSRHDTFIWVFHILCIQLVIIYHYFLLCKLSSWGMQMVEWVSHMPCMQPTPVTPPLPSMLSSLIMS